MVNRSIESKLKSRVLALPLVFIVALMLATPSLAGVHDPMCPQVEFIATDSTLADKTEFHLEATMVSDQRRIAIIDGSTVSVGDQYQGHFVTSIDKGCVVLAQRGKKTSLTLQPIIKTRTDEANGTLHQIRGVE